MTKPTAYPPPLDRDPDFAPDPAAVPTPFVSDAAVRTICRWVAGTVLGLGTMVLVGWMSLVLSPDAFMNVVLGGGFIGLISLVLVGLYSLMKMGVPK